MILLQLFADPTANIVKVRSKHVDFAYKIGQEAYQTWDGTSAITCGTVNSPIVLHPTCRE